MKKTSVAALAVAAVASAALVSSVEYAVPGAPAGQSSTSASGAVCRCAPPVSDTWCNGKTCWPTAQGIEYRPAAVS